VDGAGVGVAAGVAVAVAVAVAVGGPPDGESAFGASDPTQPDASNAIVSATTGARKIRRPRFMLIFR
jgi:hypothetical protein